MNIFAQIMGIFAIITWVISILLKKKKNIILSQIIANAIYAIEYISLHAYSATCMNLLSVLRLIIYYAFNLINKDLPKLILFVFSLLIILLGMATYNKLLDIIPIIVTLLYAYSLWQNDLKITRIIYICAALIWIYYNFKVSAFIGIIGNILEIIFGIISIEKYHGKGSLK